MKKLHYLSLALVGFVLMTGCKKDPVAPTIDIYEGDEGEACITENAQVFSGDEITVGFMGTGEKLSKIDIVLSQDGTPLDSFSHSWENPSNDFTITAHFTVEAVGTVTVTGTVTDAVGQTALKRFDIFYDERPKPDTDFTGEYDGTALVNGNLVAEIPGMDPIQQEYSREYEVHVFITEGENDNEVTAECHVNDRVFTATGTVEGNTVTVNDLHDTFTFDYEYNGMTFSPEINVIYSLTATLDGDVLTFEGTYEGSGDITVIFITGTVNLDGTFNGSLDKMEWIRHGRDGVHTVSTNGKRMTDGPSVLFW